MITPWKLYGGVNLMLVHCCHQLDRKSTSKMIRNKIKNIFKRPATLRRYNNVVEAVRMTRILLKIFGTTVFELSCDSANRVASSFNPLGFLFYLALISAYSYCSYMIYYEDQTILRMLHDTKLRRYGDDFETCSAIVFTGISMILTPFKINGNRAVVQKIVDIDVYIEKTGFIIDFDKLARTAMSVSLGQIIVYFMRLICIYVSLSSSIHMPVAKMCHVCMSDIIALINTTLYCYHLLILIDQFKWVNTTLHEIKSRNSWEYKMFARSSVPPNLVKVVELQDRQVCEKIKNCARVYSMLFDACNSVSCLFGLSLLFTMFFNFNYIILYLFYFMEATASGLFHDLRRYFDFLVYTFWEIIIAAGIILLIIVFSEMTVNQAKKTSVLIHEIINEDFGPAINNEAMKFSMQLLHEMPMFTVCGLFNLDYGYLQQAVRSVSTYLIILLQFVMEND